MCLLVFELVLFLSPVLQERNMAIEKDIYGKVGYNDPSKAIIKSINEKDNSFFRIEKDYTSSIAMHYGYNEAKMQDYYTSNGYISYTNANYLRFLKLIGIEKNPRGVETIWIKGLVNAPIPMKLCNVKYYLSKSNDTLDIKRKDLNFLYEKHGIKVFVVKHALPLGITYNKILTNEKFMQLDSLSKQNALLQAIVLNDDDSVEYKDLVRVKSSEILIDTSFNRIKLWTDELRKDTLTITQFKHNDINGKIQLMSSKMMFFAIPYHKGWQLTVNNKPKVISKVFGGLMGVYLTSGNHQINLHFDDPYKKIGSIISLVSILLFVIVFVGKVMFRKFKVKNP